MNLLQETLLEFSDFETFKHNSDFLSNKNIMGVIKTCLAKSM